MDLNQKQIIRRLKDGDERTFELVFKEYYQYLVLYANKYLSDIELSKEIVQDLFVHLYEKRNSFNISTSLKSYLFRSVYNRSMNEISAQKIRNKYADHIKNRAGNNQINLEKELEHNELQEIIVSAITELPPKCRQIFTMNRFEGRSNSEIADELQISKRTVETQISKALKFLRTKLNPYVLNQE